MRTQTGINLVSNPGLFLIFGLLAGMLIHDLALGVLGGLVCHLVLNSIYRPNGPKTPRG